MMKLLGLKTEDSVLYLLYLVPPDSHPYDRGTGPSADADRRCHGGSVEQ